MDENLRKPAKYLPAILVLLFAGAFAIATGAALVTVIQWQPMMSASPITPNGTPGSAQPGTIGLARPHPPMR